ncbi:pleckstrin homology-like domain family B member 1 isoform X2 [Danaus plexippus]|uniref:pleckstrin homology-like domain family B member 1 isoform X2 n=1 Tax=Danaus plexippus TaxID=13037 RepID=UPI002AB10912|nr:pleckstrin homology-like domain family B member 1 isoform X2 [Danaus plexippus]
MTTTKGKNASKLIKNFIKNLKKNTSAMRRLKRAYELHSNKNSIHELIKIINEKLDVVHKIRNDIKMYRTVNTVLTNHYIRETRDRERDIGGRMIDLEEQILRAYEGLRSDIMKIVASDRNVIAVTNNMYRNNEASDKKQIYDGIIRRIDGLFTGAAHQDRVKEEEQKVAETARLEEILNMCAEYEKQITSGVPITPTEKRSHNKIITNGSLPRSVTVNNPNFVQTTDGYYRFDTSHKNTNSQLQRNVSGYENFESPRTEPVTPVVSTENYENIGRMDEIGIPLYEDADKELSSPVMIRKLSQNTSPISSPYENVYLKNNMGIKPKSPNTQSPRTRIKTSFAHKNLPSPQYFIFPPTDAKTEAVHNETAGSISCNGIEEKLSLDDEIPMIDDLDITNDIELRHSKVERDEDKLMTKNKSFDDVKKELMADIPELEEFENDLNKRDKIQGVADVFRSIDIEENSIDSVIYESAEDLKSRYENLKEERRKLMAQIHDVKCKMTEIRSQEDDILRELEMEKALIKGEYDSEIAILNIEQKKKTELLDSIKKIEEDIRLLKDKQEARQKEMRDRVDIATMKVEKLEMDLKDNKATLEELQNAQDILENETRIYEDLEFTQLEEESELLSNREDVQNELSLLIKKIDEQKTRILTLKSEANDNLTSAVEETKVLQAEYVKLLNEVEHLTGKVQIIEQELKPIVTRLNEDRTQSPDSAFYTDQTRAKSGEFGYSPQTSDDDDLVDHAKQLKEKFTSIDRMSQSMIVDIERRVADLDDPVTSPYKAKEKKGFWERNFDSLKRKKKKAEKVDLMSQSLNENIFYNDNIEADNPTDNHSGLKNSKRKNVPLKSNSSSKIPTFAALGKIIKKDSLKRKETQNKENKPEETGNRYVKNNKTTDNKYKSKSLSPDKQPVIEETTFKVENLKVLHRKSCGDEPTRVDYQKITDSGKIPSQDDIDRISKVTIDAPILPSDTDVNTLGKRTLDSLMEIERKRIEMLEEKGCQMIENEREKISELKKRVQDETKKLWDQRAKDQKPDTRQSPVSVTAVSLTPVSLTAANLACEFDSPNSTFGNEDVSFDYNMTSSTIYEESSGFLSSSIEELQRNSRTESAEEDRRSDDSRPLSHASDFSRDNILSNAPRRSRRGVSVSAEWRRPLTRYLPVDREDFDLRTHVESAGHQVELCPYVSVSSSSCRGYLHKLGAKFHTWSKRWFVFDRESKTFVYYWDKSERKPRGGAYFQVIEEVYLDHGNTSKSPSPQTTFIVKTKQRRYYLMAPSGEAARIWIDVIFTGAQGYTEYLE